MTPHFLYQNSFQPLDENHIALSVEAVELSICNVDMLGAACCDRRSSFDDLDVELAFGDGKDVVDFMRERVWACIILTKYG